MSTSANQQLIHDLIDGQLSVDQAQHARQLMAEDVDLAEFHDSLMEQRSALRGLPKFQLDEDFANRVLAAADKSQTSTDQPVQAKPTPRTNFQWTGAVAAVASLAALLLVTLFVIPQFAPESNMASLETTAETAEDENASTDAPVERAEAIDPKEQLFEFGDDALSDRVDTDTSDKHQQTLDSPRPKNAADSEINDEALAEKNLERSQNRAFAPEINQRAMESATPKSARAMKTKTAETDEEFNLAQKDLGNEGMSRGDGQRWERTRAARTPAATRNALVASEPAGGLEERGRRMGTDTATLKSPNLLVFNVVETEESIRLINQVFADNKIKVELPATLNERRKLSFNDTSEQQSPVSNTLGFQVRVPAEQMKNAILAINQESEIVAFESLGTAQIAGIQTPQLGGRELTPKQFSRQRKPTTIAGRVGAGGGLGEGHANQDLKEENDLESESPRELQSAQLGPEFDARETIREINEYFRLDPEQDNQQARDYTLIFSIRKPQVETSPAASDENTPAAPPKSDDK